MRLSRRAFCGTAAAGALGLVAGCAGAPEPPPEDVQTLHDAVREAYDAEGAAVEQEIRFDADESGANPGRNVVADFRILDEGADVETLRERYQRTTVLVLEHLFGTEVTVNDATIRGYVMWDDNRDLSPDRKETQVASVYVTAETAGQLEFSTLDPTELSDAADNYTFDEAFLREERWGENGDDGDGDGDGDSSANGE